MSDDERRAVARRLRKIDTSDDPLNSNRLLMEIEKVIGTWRTSDDWPTPEWLIGRNRDTAERLADLIEPSYKPDAKYEAWYSSLSHYGDERGGPSTIRELIEEIVWTALTVDLGPNGNTDPSTGIDEGGVYTNNLFAEWEREALRLTGGRDRVKCVAEVKVDGEQLEKLAHDAAVEMFGKMRHSTKEEAGAYDAMLKSKSVEIHSVDRDALLELADKMRKYARLRSSNGMDVDAMAVMAWVHRIREACGEVVE